MLDLPTTLAGATAAVGAVGALGTAAYGLVDATKAFGGGVSNFGFPYILRALGPFEAALDNANVYWKATIRANWINGVAKEDQKAAARSLIRLGLSSKTIGSLAAAGRVSETSLKDVLERVETGGVLTTEDAQLLGRLNAAIDASMDAGFERGDQSYRNAARLTAGIFSVLLSLWGGYLTANSHLIHGEGAFWVMPSLFVGLVAVPIAPVAKDLASSLQAAAAAVQAVKR
jgi:hypothetical protein